MLLTDYLFDFCAAYVLGIAFQYFSIAPMRHISGWPAIKAALKADTVALIAFEFGLFAVMYWMHRSFRPHLNPTQPEYWFLMQMGMIVGFFTSFPANWWLIKKGWKETM
jgi:drug/metabolite transporter (DMT)-like permease